MTTKKPTARSFIKTLIPAVEADDRATIAKWCASRTTTPKHHAKAICYIAVAAAETLIDRIGKTPVQTILDGAGDEFTPEVSVGRIMAAAIARDQEMVAAHAAAAVNAGKEFRVTVTVILIRVLHRELQK